MAASGSRRTPSASSSTSDRGWQGNVLCRYFMADSCRAGANCPFSHDRSISNRGTLPCKYFSQGTCAFGNNCKFSHTKTTTASSNGVISRQNQISIPSVRQPAAPATTTATPAAFAPRRPALPPPPIVSIERLTSNFQNLGGLSRTTSSSFGNDTSWAEAPEFVPRSYEETSSYYFPAEGTNGYEPPKTWAQVAELTPAQELQQQGKSWAFVVNPNAASEMSIADAESQLCSFYIVGECRYNENCSCIHGDVCEFCGKAILHPDHEKQRKHHKETCMLEIEAEMEHSFGVAKSKDKTCGICMEVVMEKPKPQARFGIMPSCNHCFCLECLRKWRQAKQFEHKIVRACPECRQTSDFICPSRYWVDTKEEKEKLLSDYREALNKKECKYFKRGEGECPFGNKCFYRHLSADGLDIDVGPPSRRQRRQNADGEVEPARTFLLYNFLEERDGRIQMLPLDILDIIDMFSDSE